MDIAGAARADDGAGADDAYARAERFAHRIFGVQLALGVIIHGGGGGIVAHRAIMHAAMDIGGGDKDEAFCPGQLGGAGEVNGGIHILAPPCGFTHAAFMAQPGGVNGGIHIRQAKARFSEVSGNDGLNALRQLPALPHPAIYSRHAGSRVAGNGAANIAGGA